MSCFDQVRYMSGMQTWFLTFEISIIHCISRIKKIICTILFMNAEKALTKIQYLFIIKTKKIKASQQTISKTDKEHLVWIFSPTK